MKMNSQKLLVSATMSYFSEYVQQVLTRSVTVLKSGTLEDISKLLIADVDFGLHIRTSTEIVSAYLGIPSPIEDLTFKSSIGDDLRASSCDTEFINNQTRGFGSSSGTVFEMKVSKPMMTPNTLSRIVMIDGVRYHPDGSEFAFTV